MDRQEFESFIEFGCILMLAIIIDYFFNNIFVNFFTIVLAYCFVKVVIVIIKTKKSK